MRRPPQPDHHAHANRRLARASHRTARTRATAPIDLRRAAPRAHRCGHGAPFTLAFLVRLIGGGDLLV
jgi:hypothetical protein